MNQREGQERSIVDTFTMIEWSLMASKLGL